MPTVFSNGVGISYEVAGEGPPLVLLHGLGESGKTHWVMTGWVDALKDRNRVIVVDQRGHGRSGKPRQRVAYSLDLMARDVVAVLDSLQVDRAVVFGYSMGAMVAMELLINHPGRVSAAILGGMGASFPRRGDWRRGCRDEEREPPPPLRRRRPGSRLPALLERFRHFDPLAQQAIRRTLFRGGPVDRSRLGEIRAPVLIVCGTRDALCPGTRELAAKLPAAERVVLSGRGHLTAVADPRFRNAVREFLARVGAGETSAPESQ